MTVLFVVLSWAFIVIVALAVLALLGFFGVFLWLFISEPYYRRKRESAPILRVETELVEFSKRDGDNVWEGIAEFDGTEISVYADDVDGQLDPPFVNRLPEIVNNLSEFERIARSDLGERLSTQHKLSSISGPSLDDTYDFQLGFNFDENSWGETVFVDFIGRKVVGSGSVD